MARGYVVFGEFIVKVIGSVDAFDGTEELGLTIDPVRIVPRYNHLDVMTDDYGPDVPVETLWNMADAVVHMTLVNYDPDVLNKCMRAAMGGGGLNVGNPTGSGSVDGFMGMAGTPMGGGVAMEASGNNYVMVFLIPTDDGEYNPYRFVSCYLNSQPLEIPLGTERSLVKLAWRCVPYRPFNGSEITSYNNGLLWDHLYPEQV